LGAPPVPPDRAVAEARRQRDANATLVNS